MGLTLALIIQLTLTLTVAQLPPPFEFESPKLGKIRGSISSTFKPTPYYQFQGLPHGNAQINGRFMPSVPVTGKLGVTNFFDATNVGSSCVQRSAFGRDQVDFGSVGRIISSGGKIETVSNSGGSRRATGSEDCLFINVFTRNVSTTENPRRVPVVVFIHGGAFNSGSSNFYEGHRLLDEDVVLVTFNYRLGVLGFFSLNTEDAPGNAAMYDMVNALEWVQTYIEDFGGNPDSVTLMGQSAGAAAVIHLMSSPLGRGLFHKAIALSGSGANEWGLTSSTRAMKASLRIAELVGCYIPVEGVDPNLRAISNCMALTDDLDAIVDQTSAYQLEEQILGRLGFDATSPVVQTASAQGLEIFLEKETLEVFEAGEQMKVPLMMGTTLHDGSFPLGVLYNNYLVPNSFHNDSGFLRQQLVPQILNVFGISDDSNAIYDAVGKTYLEDKRDSGVFAEMMPGLIDLDSVFFFKADAYKTLQLHSKSVPNSFWYSFEYQGSKSLFGLLFGFNPPPVYGGVSHGDDLIYLFGIPFFTDLDDEELAVSAQFVKYFTNFAATGNPNNAVAVADVVHWPSYDTSRQNYLSLNLESAALQKYVNGWESAADVLLPTPATSTTTAASTTTTRTTAEPTTVPNPNTANHTKASCLLSASVVIIFIVVRRIEAFL